MADKWRDARDCENMKKVYKVATRTVMWISSQYTVQAVHYQLWLFVSYVQLLWLYTGIRHPSDVYSYE